MPDRAPSDGLIVDEPGTCPTDSEFVHDNYFNCVPKDFNPNTGRSKAHKQSVGADNHYHWDGGCDWKAW
jgi:hypothetical protein